MRENEYDVIVIGMGLSGLMAAMTLAAGSKRVLIIGKGMGSLCLFSNSVDVMKSMEGRNLQGGISAWISGHPDHPYTKVGVERIIEALSCFSSLFDEPYTFTAPCNGNWRIPTAAGTYRFTFLVPSTMASGVDIGNGGIIVGIEEFRDFSALQASRGLNVRGATIALGGTTQSGVTSLALARLMEKPSFRGVFSSEVKKRLEGENRVGLPAVLGLRNPGRVKKDLMESIGAEVFEMPGLPPSIPGLRIFNRFKEWFDQKAEVTFLLGQGVDIGMVEGRTCTGVRVTNAPVSNTFRADSYILASGRFLSGGLVADEGKLYEPLFGLPIVQPSAPDGWFRPFFFGAGHPTNEAGIEVDRHFRPVDSRGNVLLENVRVAGSILAHHNSVEEGSREGISLSTGYAAAVEAMAS
jgi:glycerol-3-phosphate dehydrogenase subunit B